MALRRFAVQFGLRAQAPVADLAASWGRAFATVLPELKYAKSHEWAKAQGDVAVVGISDHAQGELGDVVYVELPEVGATVTKGETFGVVESVKVRQLQEIREKGAAAGNAAHGGCNHHHHEGHGHDHHHHHDHSDSCNHDHWTSLPVAASDVYSPISGEVVEINQALVDEPAKVNSSPYEDGWMIKVKLSNAGELGDLLDSSAYEAHCQH